MLVLQQTLGMGEGATERVRTGGNPSEKLQPEPLLANTNVAAQSKTRRAKPGSVTEQPRKNWGVSCQSP